MKKVCKLLVECSLVLVVVACATVTPTGGPYKEDVVSSLMPGTSRIVMYRTGGTLMGGEIPAIYIDGIFKGYLPAGAFLQEDVSPGKHNITARRADKPWRFKDPIGMSFEMPANEIAYFDLELTAMDKGSWVVPLPFVGVSNIKSTVRLHKRSKADSAEHLPNAQRVLPTDK